MQRKRVVDRWESRFSHESIASFLNSPVKNGFHSVAMGGQFFDFLVQHRGAVHNLITFHSSLSAHVKYLPAPQGVGLAESSGANLIALCDPTLVMGDLDLAWYLGNEKVGDLDKVITLIITHILNEWEARSRDALFFGVSGGAFPALRAGRMFPLSTVLAVNPRLDLNAAPTADIKGYEEIAFAGMRDNYPQSYSLSEFPSYDSAHQKLGDRLPMKVMIFQNEGDKVFWNNQFSPFVEKYSHDPNLFIRTENYAAGHKPVPSVLMKEITGYSFHSPYHAGFKIASDWKNGKIG